MEDLQANEDAHLLKYLIHHADSLLRLWKRRSGVEEGRLVFVGMANLASYWWCAAKAILHSRRNERVFFISYLYDRIHYSQRLGYIKSLPSTPEELLDVGDSVTIEDVERLFRAEAEAVSTLTPEEIVRGRLKEVAEIMLESLIGPDEQFLTSLIELRGSLTEALRRDDRELACRSLNSIRGGRRLLGSLCETLLAEVYPTIRWNFRWDPYVVVGVPDGMTSDLVYEFKCSSNRYLAGFNRPVALAQADIYGYFFKRPKKRVQIFVIDECKLETWETLVDARNAEETIKRFAEVDEDLSRAKPPVWWKCKNCEFARGCPTVSSRHQEG